MAHVITTLIYYRRYVVFTTLCFKGQFRMRLFDYYILFTAIIKAAGPKTCTGLITKFLNIVIYIWI